MCVWGGVVGGVLCARAKGGGAASTHRLLRLLRGLFLGGVFRERLEKIALAVPARAARGAGHARKGVVELGHRQQRRLRARRGAL